MSKTIKVALFAFVAWVTLVTIYVSLTNTNRGIKLCLNGETLSSDSSLISSGWSKAGPWVILKNEILLYQKLAARGMDVSSDGEIRYFVPKEFSDLISSKMKIIRIEAEAGRYLYIAKREGLIYIWSVTL